MLKSKKLFALSLLAIVNLTNCMNFKDNLHALTDAVARKHFSVFRCLTYVTDDTTLPFWSSSQQVLLVKTDAKDFDNLIRKGYEDGCNGFIVRTSNHSRTKILEMMIQIYKNSLESRYNDKRYLILPEDEDDGDTAFLDTHDMYYLPNLVFVAPSGKSFEIIGHNYFNGYKYDVLDIKHEILDIWHPSEGFERNQELYPNKMVNLHGKVIKFSLLQFSPYTIVIQDGDRFIFDGLETRIAAQFVEASNGTWIGRDNPIHLWGDIFSNGSGTGIFGTVLDNTVDMGFSAIYQWYCHILECSYPYIYARVTCLAPKPDVISGWQTVILPFAPSAWTAFIITYLTVPLFVFSVSLIWNRLKNEAVPSFIELLADSFFNAFRLQLEQIPKLAHQKTAVAYFFKMWTVYCFFVAACWQGGIASFLTVPRYEDPINDAADLISRYPEVQWGANHNAWTKSIEKASDPVMKKIVKQFVVQDDATLRGRVAKKDFAYFVERLPNGHFGLNDYIDREGMKYLRIMDHYIYFGYCVIIMTRGSPYQERLNQILHRMINTGIILKMEVEVALELTDNRLHTMVRTSAEKPKDVITNLKVSHILGALMVYLFGTIISIIAFVAELRSFKRVTSFPVGVFFALKRFRELFSPNDINQLNIN